MVSLAIICQKICFFLILTIINSNYFKNEALKMSFKSENSNINTILSRNYSYVIPLNQRKYVWENSE